MIKRQRNRLIALGGILAVAGCSGGGGSAPAPVAKPARSANHPLSTVKLTINPTLLRHASSSRRRPAFLDPGNGQAFGGTLSLVVTSTTDDGSGIAPQPTTQAMSLGSTAPVTLSVPLYGPSGFIRVQEIYQSATVSIAPQLIADTDPGGLASTNIGAVAYKFDVGQDSTVQIGVNGPGGVFSAAPVTLNAVVGGIVVSNAPDGSSANTTFVPLSNPNFLDFVAQSAFVFVFPADATGGFTPSSVPGGFPNAVTVTAGQTFPAGFTFTSTLIPGAFVYDAASCASGLIVFDVVDGLGNHGSTAGSGYLNMINEFC